jgi:hypothetical protein
MKPSAVLPRQHELPAEEADHEMLAAARAFAAAVDAGDTVEPMEE